MKAKLNFLLIIILIILISILLVNLKIDNDYKKRKQLHELERNIKLR